MSLIVNTIVISMMIVWGLAVFTALFIFIKILIVMILEVLKNGF